MSESEARVLVGIPSGEKTIPTQAFLQFLALAARSGHSIVGTSEGPVSYVREQLVRKFLAEKEFTHLLMLDSDHIHPPDIVERLTRWLEHPSHPQIVSGLNYSRREPYRPCAFMWGDDELSLLTINHWPSGLVKVDAVGAASLLVAREVFERIPAPWFRFAYLPTASGEQKFIGEDIWFCAEARKAGIDVWLDTTTTSPHIGERLVGDADYRGWLAAQTTEMTAGTVQTQMAGGIDVP